MALTIACRKIRQLKSRSHKMLESAKEAGQASQQDPLFRQLGDLSNLVTEIESIKKRHAAVLKRCLLLGVNGIANWHSEIMPDKYMSGKEMILCWNEVDGRICAFETKRGHGNYDSSSLAALDHRLYAARKSLDQAANDLNMPNACKQVFVVSFYGKVWKLHHKVYTPKNIDNIFNPELTFMLSSFMEFHRKMIEDEYNGRFPQIRKQGNLDLAGGPNIFLDISDHEIRKFKQVKICGKRYHLEGS